MRYVDLKIAIIGYSGSGKSTLATNLGKALKLPVLHLDTVQFKANWVERDLEESLQIIKEFMQNDNWIIDGSYSKFLQKERFEQADKIIFLNFNRFYCFYRAYKRYLENKGRTRSDMADGCIEKFDFEFAMWILKDGRNANKRNSFKNITEIYSDKSIVLHNQKEIDEYLLEIKKLYG